MTSGTAAFVLREATISTAQGPAPVPLIVCEPLERAGFPNAFSTRWGGVSEMPAASLHLAFGHEDRALVNENRRRFLEALGVSDRPLVTAKQTHSDRRLLIDQPPDGEPDGDALMTRHSGLVLAVKTADCTPLLIADPQTGAMAAVHAGWRGTLARIASKTVTDLRGRLGCDPGRLIAAVGPAACGECYEVGADVAGPVRSAFGGCHEALRAEDGRTTLDVSALNVSQLEEAGVPRSNIHLSNYCTIHQNDLFFSHRAESGAAGGRVGRLASAITGLR